MTDCRSKDASLQGIAAKYVKENSCIVAQSGVCGFPKPPGELRKNGSAHRTSERQYKNRELIDTTNVSHSDSEKIADCGNNNCEPVLATFAETGHTYKLSPMLGVPYPPVTEFEVYQNGGQLNPVGAEEQVNNLLPINYRHLTDSERAHAYGSYVEQPLVERSRGGVKKSQQRRKLTDNQGGTIDACQQPETVNAAKKDARGSPQNADGCLDTENGFMLKRNGIHVRGLCKEITDEDLRRMFERFGPIVTCQVHVNAQTREPLGYGTVEFADQTSASAALQENYKLPGFKVSILRVPVLDSTNVYVCNLPPLLNEADLQKLFSECGRVISVRILRNCNQVSLGIGFARMSNQRECEQVIAHFNGRQFNGSPRPLVVKFADDSSAKRCVQRRRNELYSRLPKIVTQPHEQAIEPYAAPAYPQPQPQQLVPQNVFNYANAAVNEAYSPQYVPVTCYPQSIYQTQPMVPNAPVYPQNFVVQPTYNVAMPPDFSALQMYAPPMMNMTCSAAVNGANFMMGSTNMAPVAQQFG